MGNYKLNSVIASTLAKEYTEFNIALIEQLNGRLPDQGYIQQLIEFRPDIIYYEMLDHNTFEMIAKYFKHSLKILCCTSLGVLKDIDAILQYKGLYYDKILTNSRRLQQIFKFNGIVTEHFKYYLSVIPSHQYLEYEIKYNNDCTFLGMGFNRQTSVDYALERDLFFSNDSGVCIYGNGWDDIPDYKGILPPDDIGNLYFSSNCAVGIIAKSQRELGMINNRYVEIINSYCPVISINYNTIDWFGMEKFINFVDNKNHFNFVVNKFKDDDYRHDWIISAKKFFDSNFKGEFEHKFKILMELN